MKNKGWKSTNDSASEKPQEKLVLNKNLKISSHLDEKVSSQHNGSPEQNHDNGKNNKEKASLPDIIPESKVDKPDGKELDADNKNNGQSLDENENIPEDQKNEKTLEKQNLLIEEKIAKKRKGKECFLHSVPDF